VRTFRLTLVALGACVVTLATPGLTGAQRRPVAPARVAITIDDVPWNGPRESDAAMLAATDRMIAALRAHRAPVAVFVNCARLGEHDPILGRWVAAGATIGNHTARHRDLNRAPLAEWSADVRSCDADLRAATGTAVRWFRYPMLHEGRTSKQRAAATALLREQGYQNAVVTIDNSDYLLARGYAVAAGRGDSARARALASAALAHDLRATHHFQAFARAKLGRDASHVLLLHANAMTAELMAPLLDSLARRGFRFVSLAEATTDPLLRQPSCYRGSRGVSVLYRIPPCTSGDDAWDRAAEREILRRFPEAAAVR
jgi:peptidoglycan/xylan/chitin deacetylase (PgdA/CDA1 family)